MKNEILIVVLSIFETRLKLGRIIRPTVWKGHLDLQLREIKDVRQKIHDDMIMINLSPWSYAIFLQEELISVLFPPATISILPLTQQIKFRPTCRL